MTFHKCPECGETNYAENNWAARKFDCGFIGDGRRRANRCNADKGQRGQTSIPAEVARYRLALLDAAQVAETIAADMDADSRKSASVVDGGHASRCRALARQMRDFAGHSNFQVAHESHALARFLPKIWSR